MPKLCVSSVGSKIRMLSCQAAICGEKTVFDIFADRIAMRVNTKHTIPYIVHKVDEERAFPHSRLAEDVEAAAVFYVTD